MTQQYFPQLDEMITMVKCIADEIAVLDQGLRKQQQYVYVTESYGQEGACTFRIERSSGRAWIMRYHFGNKTLTWEPVTVQVEQ